MPNFVKDQFPSESLSSFQTSVTTAATAGPANTTAATLSNLAQSMENTPVGASVNVSHSVPNPLGNITSFAATIQQINEKLQQDPNNGKRYLEALANDDPIRAAKYNEWLGLCALVALRNVYSMNGLQVELVYEQFEDEPFDRAVLFLAEKYGLPVQLDGRQDGQYYVWWNVLPESQWTVYSVVQSGSGPLPDAAV